MAGQGQAPANALQPYPQQTMQQARFMPNQFNMNKPMGGFSPMAGFNPMMMSGFNPMGGYGGYSAPQPAQSNMANQEIPQNATVTTTTPEQTPGYVQQAPVKTVTYTDTPKPVFQGGMAQFAAPMQLSRRQLTGRELASPYTPLQFITPKNVSVSRDFASNLQALQNQYMPIEQDLYTKSGRLNRNKVKEYNRRLQDLSGNLVYQKSVRDLLEREGLGGLLGA